MFMTEWGIVGLACYAGKTVTSGAVLVLHFNSKKQRKPTEKKLAVESLAHFLLRSGKCETAGGVLAASGYTLHTLAF